MIDPNAGVFYLKGGFTSGPGGSINPHTQQVTFSVGSYSVTLPGGSFAANKTGYVYQKRSTMSSCAFISGTPARRAAISYWRIARAPR